MKSRAPIFARDVTAARLLDLQTGQFVDLVEKGHLPRGKEIAPGVLRWDIEVLRQISKCEDAAEGIDW